MSHILSYPGIKYGDPSILRISLIFYSTCAKKVMLRSCNSYVVKIPFKTLTLESIFQNYSVCNVSIYQIFAEVADEQTLIS